MKKTLEATSNTESGAKQRMEKKMKELQETTNVEFGERRVFGNFEYGYKICQDYIVID